MKEDNEIIAKFMGVEFKPDHTGKKYWHYDQLTLVSSNLLFDDSWNWLMPVVEKISEFRLVYPKEAGFVCDCKVVIGRKYLYREVLSFIKWHNQQPK